MRRQATNDRREGATGIVHAICLLGLFSLFTAGCATAEQPRSLYVLRWVERPSSEGPSTQALSEDITQFDMVARYDKGAVDFIQVRDTLREGDVIAYRMSPLETVGQLLVGRVNAAGYGLIKYGHLAILVGDPDAGTAPENLRLLSSVSFVGPNTREGIDTLARHNWDAYRLDQWGRVDAARLRDFAELAEKRAGRWYGYDFSGMFGLWNSNLTPREADEVGHDYICSTIVLASLYHCGVELDAVRRWGVLDVCTPQQVVASKGRIVAPPPAELVVDEKGTGAAIALD